MAKRLGRWRRHPIVGLHLEIAIVPDLRHQAEGAQHDEHDEPQRLILQNLKLCRIETGYRILREDVFTAMRFLARQGFKANIAFFDPPYDWKPYRDLLEITFGRGLLSQDGVAVIEHFRKADLPESGDGYERSRIVCQGDHCLSFFSVRE